MNQGDSRFIHSRSSCGQVQDLLQIIFTAEILAPSRCLWLISPWISDIRVIDNRANRFIHLDPEWRGREVCLSEVIGKLLNLGTTVRVVTRPLEHNNSFVEKMQFFQSSGLPISVKVLDELHEKGLLGDYYYLSGSMNFTFMGITVNDESIHYHTARDIVAENRLVFASRWGAEI
ncbi:MAG: hypothetical protein GX244_04925 [Firmicutes bacterium]|jgi:hypothetical protein|nr:hypothetical protein [Bacillota bacterium]